MKVKVEFLAKFFDREARTIQLWAAQGMPKEDKGLYDLIDCARWYIKKLREEIEELKVGDQTIYQLRKTEQEIRIEERQLKLDKLRGDSISLELVKRAWYDTSKIIVKYLDGLAVNINTRLAGNAETLSKIREGINDFRESFSRIEPDYFMPEIDGEEPEQEDENDD